MWGQISQIKGGKYSKSHNINYNNITIEDGKTFSWGGEYSDDYLSRDTLFTNLGVFGNYKPNILSSINKGGNFIFS